MRNTRSIARPRYLSPPNKHTRYWRLDFNLPKDFLPNDFGLLGQLLTLDRYRGPRAKPQKLVRHMVISTHREDMASAHDSARELIGAYILGMNNYKRRKFNQVEFDAASRKNRPLNPENIRDVPFQGITQYQYADGKHVINDRWALVDGSTITYVNDDGSHETAPNPVSRSFVQIEETKSPDLVDAIQMILPADEIELPKSRLPPPLSADDQLIERYVNAPTHLGVKKKSKGLTGEIRNSWAAYKAAVNIPLIKATFTDCVQMAVYLKDQGNKHDTIKQKLKHLSVAIKFDMKTSQLQREASRFKHNPFQYYREMLSTANIQKDSTKILPFRENQMEQLWKVAPILLDADDFLLWKLLAKTGARLGEALSIDHERYDVDAQLRYAVVGTKNVDSERRIPLPTDIGLPPVINGPLFPRAPEASKRLNDFVRTVLDDAVLTKLPNGKEEKVVVHSLRHRAINVFDLSTIMEATYYSQLLTGHKTNKESQTIHKKVDRAEDMRSMKMLLDDNPIDGTWISPNHVIYDERMKTERT